MYSKIYTEMSPDEFKNCLKTICTEVLEKLLSEELEKANEKLLTRKEAANVLKITLPTLYAWTKKGILPVHALGKKKFYKLSDLMGAPKKKGANHVR